MRLGPCRLSRVLVSKASARLRASRFAIRRTTAALAVVAHLGAAVVASSVMFVASNAFAEPAKRKTLAVYVEGNFASDTRDDILSVLPEHITIVDKGDTTSAMRKFGLTKPMGGAMTQAKTRSGFVPRLRKAAKEAGADGFIVGIVQRFSGKWRVYIVWLSPDGDDLLIDEAVSREGSEEDRRSALKSALASTVEQFAPKPSDTPSKKSDKPKGGSKGGDSDATDQPEEDKEEDSSDKPKRVRHEVSSSIFGVELGLEATGRFFRYSDGITNNLRKYDAFPAPAFFVAAEVYPAAMTTIPVLRDVGIIGSYSRMFGLQSKTNDGSPINTVYQRYSVGLRVRIPISRPTGPVFGVSGQYYVHTFQVDEPPELEGQIPNVNYSAIRAGADARFPLGRTALTLGFDWIEPLSSGTVYDRFTAAKVHGVGGKLGFVIKIASGFELRMAAEYSRFFSDFDPVLGDSYVAGGALDHYLGLRLSGAYVE